MGSFDESQDIVEKNFVAFPDIAADLVNVFVHGGLQKVEADSLLPAPTESVYQGNSRLRNQYQDVVKYEMKSGRPRIVYQFANQSTVDYRMLLRKAGYTGAAYGEQYEEKLPAVCPVMEMVLYWGKGGWNAPRSMRRLFRRKEITEDEWRRIDDLELHVWEMRHLPQDVRGMFRSDMRIVADYLAGEDISHSDRLVAHKEALIKMIRVLSGGENVGDTAEFMRERNIREEDDVTVADLFEQYRNQGIDQGIEALISACKEFGVGFDATADKVGEKFHLEEEEVDQKMRLYWQ